MKQYITKLLALVAVTGAVACTANYEDINTNPYQPSDVTADDYKLGSAMNAMAGCVVSPDVNTAQFTDCLLGGTQGGYFADANAGWRNTISNYNPTDDWTRVLLKTDRIIPVLYTNLSAVNDLYEQTGDPVPYAIGTIIKVATMHRVADAFGPIPYSQIGADGKINTPYDALEDVYDAFFKELDFAIDNLTEHQNAALVASADYIYGGDVRKWVKFANSLKLRLAIRIAYANEAKARQMAEAAVSHEIGVIESNADNACWNYFAASVNPLYTAVNYNPATHEDGSACSTTGDSHVAADIICYMNGYNDPRRAAYFTKSEWDGEDYVGLRRGIIIPDHMTVGHKYSGPKIAPADPLLWLNAAEVAFLRAEGTAIFGFSLGGDAESFYNEGIRLSFEQWGVADAVSAYINDDESIPTTYVDPAGTNTYAGTLSTITVKWDAAASKEEMQEHIIVQKWLANWQLGNEAWADYRRTGYPKMIPASDAGNKSNGEVDSARGARRMRYPLDEYVSNAANVQKAVSEYLGGPDLMSTDLWWACKK